MYRKRDDQASVDEFITKRNRLRVPYKCENCSDIKEYDPDIAGDAIPCHSCNSPQVRSNANPGEAHMMRPRTGDY